MIDEEIEVQTVLGINLNVKHTYITNSNTDTSFGEIRFYNDMSSTFNTNPLDPNPPPYKVKIATNGKLYLYYSYDPAIALSIPGGWIDINQLYGRQTADNINQGLTLAALQYEISSLSAMTSAGTAVPIPDLGKGVPTVSTIQATETGLAANVYSVQSRIAATTGGGFAVAWGIGYAIFDAIKNNDLANAFVYQLKQNKQSNLDAGNITDANTIQDTINYTSNNFFLSNLSNFNYNFSNLSLSQGFINTNIVSQQTISNLNTLYLKINNQSISSIFVPQNGGNMYDSLVFQKSTSDNPTVGYFDGTGARVVYQPSTTTTDYACSIGVNNTTKKFWFSASSNYAYEYWFGGANTLIINSNVLSFDNGIINATTLQQNSQNITDISSNIVLTQTPNVQKKTGFLINVHNPVYTDGSVLVYSYDIYLPSYISQAIVENTSDPYRTFRIHISYASSYFEYLVNGLPNCCSYEIFMSYKANAGSGGIGKQYLNICALGTPENFYLDKVMPNNLYIMRSPFSYFDSICVISTKIADVRVIIEDLLN